MKAEEIILCPICLDASDDCDCSKHFPEEDPRDNPLIGEDDWIHDQDMGAR